MFRRKRQMKEDQAVSLSPVPARASRRLVYDVSTSYRAIDQSQGVLDEHVAVSASSFHEPRYLDNDEESAESISDDDERSIRSLTKLSPEEREKANRRLSALQKRSMNASQNVTTLEAAELDLVSLINKKEWKHVLRKIGNDPRSISEKHVIQLDGMRSTGLPLHLALSKKPPLNVVDGMIVAYPDACRIPDETYGQLPLHIACKFRASSEVLKCTLDSHPEAVRVADSALGRLPLHYACSDGYPYDISLLIAVDKRALTSRDADGKTPVDLAHESKSPHRGQILKRIYELTKGQDKRRKGKEKHQVPATPLERQKTLAPEKSPSEVTLTTSNMSKDKPQAEKSKSMLPGWARGRRIQRMESTPVRGSSLDSPRTGNRAPPSPKGPLVMRRVSSLERLKFRRKTVGSNDIPIESFSLPSPKKAKSLPVDWDSSTFSRGGKSRRREDSVPEIATNTAFVAPSTPAGRPGDAVVPPTGSESENVDPEEASSESLDLSVDVVGQDEPPQDAPSVPRRKKKGLGTSDLMAILDGEEKKAAAIQEFGNQSAPILQLPLIKKEQSNELAFHQSMPLMLAAPPLVVPADRTTQQQTNLANSSPSNKSETTITLSNVNKGSPHSRSVSSAATSPEKPRSNVNKGSPYSRSVSSAATSPEKPRSSPPTNSFPEDEQISSFDKQLRHLKLRKAALVEECNSVNETILRKRNRVEMAKNKIAELTKQLTELQLELHKEQSSLDFAESGIKLHEEILCEHQDKIKLAEEELKTVSDKRTKLIQQKTAARLEDRSVKSEPAVKTEDDQVDREVTWAHPESGNRFDELSSATESEGAATETMSIATEAVSILDEIQPTPTPTGG